MSFKEISTKLTSEEFDKFLEICKNRNCTPSDLIKKLILSLIDTNQSNQAITKPTQQTETISKIEPQSQSLDESAAKVLIKKIENDELGEDNLQELYVKLGEKLEKTGLAKSEEPVFRMVHQKLRDKLLKRVAEKKPMTAKEKPMNVEERFQYF